MRQMEKILKKFEKFSIYAITKRQMEKIIKKFEKFPFTQLQSDKWKNYKEVWKIFHLRNYKATNVNKNVNLYISLDNNFVVNYVEKIAYLQH